MKRVVLMCALVLTLMSTAAMADTITGDVTFHGLVTLNNSTFSSATGVSTWSGVTVSSSSLTGSAGLLPVTTATTIANGWLFNSGAIAPSFWTAGSYVFKLTSSTGTNDGTFINASGTGYLTDDGGTTFTPGTWLFSTQNQGAPTFSFSASSAAVTPEPASMLLLGSGLFGLGLLRRRK